jgi:hypothetical protein
MRVNGAVFFKGYATCTLCISPFGDSMQYIKYISRHGIGTTCKSWFYLLPLNSVVPTHLSWQFKIWKVAGGYGFVSGSDTMLENMLNALC